MSCAVMVFGGSMATDRATASGDFAACLAVARLGRNTTTIDTHGFLYSDLHMIDTGIVPLGIDEPVGKTQRQEFCTVSLPR